LAGWCEKISHNSSSRGTTYQAIIRNTADREERDGRIDEYRGDLRAREGELNKGKATNNLG
jgi:hypothetical protein